MSPRIFGVVGWKNSGKTTLMAELVAEFTRRGFVVSAVKHAHLSFDIDQKDTDSYRLREAGARQVALASPKRWALMHELRDEGEMDFADIVSHIGPCDLVLVEGFKRGAFPKIEARSHRCLTTDALSNRDPHIVAIAADKAVEAEGVPVFDMADVSGIADFIARHVSLV